METQSAVEPQPMPVELTADSWYNALTGMAQANRDKREAECAAWQAISYETAMTVYQSSWLAARGVDKPVDEMLREGWEFHVADDEDLGDEIVEYHDSLELTKHVETALKWQRLFGGALVFIGVNDGITDLSQPLDETKIKSIDYLNVFDPFEARVVTWQDNPAEKDYGKPLMFRIMPMIIGNEEQRKDSKPGMGGAAGQMLLPAFQFIHASRCFMFQGTMISRRQLQLQNNPGIMRGWGDGVLARVVKLIRDFEGAWDGTSYALREFSQAIYGIQNLAASLLADKGGKDSYIQRRMRTIDMSRSLIKAVMLDKDGETFQRSDISFTGVADTMREFSTIIAAAWDMPLSVLMNTQGGGLGASGAGANDIQNWYAAVKAMQNRCGLRAFLMHMAKLTCLADDGVDAPVTKDDKGNQTIDGLKLVFRSLHQLTLQEQADLYVKLSQADEKYLNMGAITALDIGKARFSGKPLKVELVADMSELNMREKMNTEMTQTQHEVTVTNLQEHGQETPPPPHKPGFPTKK